MNGLLEDAVILIVCYLPKDVSDLSQNIRFMMTILENTLRNIFVGNL